MGDEHNEDSEPFVETLWTPEALDVYESSAQALIQRLQEHVRLTAVRQGRQRELAAYFASAEQLQKALNAFAEAELDWCGSIPVATNEPFDDDPEDELVGDPSLEQAPVVSVLGRWDYLVTDAAALMEHGRRSYLKIWPEDTGDDADMRLTTVEGAMSEILHGAPLRELDSLPGLEPLFSTVELVRHPGTSEDEFLEDPFAVRDL